MLDPKSRALLLESLRPPEGGKLDLAVGTTFSLDLLALLTAPLAFTWFSWEDDDGRPSSDPNALLEAICRHADHIHIFCQAGQIKDRPAADGHDRSVPGYPFGTKPVVDFSQSAHGLGDFAPL